MKASVPNVNPPDAEVIGRNIKRHRDRLGVSQRELGYRVGSDGNSVARWERGDVTPGVGYLHALARELKVSMEDLLKGAKAA